MNYTIPEAIIIASVWLSFGISSQHDFNGQRLFNKFFSAFLLTILFYWV